jgi:hypothetical protein
VFAMKWLAAIALWQIKDVGPSVSAKTEALGVGHGFADRPAPANTFYQDLTIRKVTKEKKYVSFRYR